DAQGRLLYEPEEALDFYLDTLQAAGVRLLLDTSVATVQRAGSRLESVTALTRGGMRAFTAKLYIDATGDGQAAFLAGVPFTLGREADHGMQPMSMMVTVGGVDPAQAEHVTFGMRPEWQALLSEQVARGLVPAPAGHVILIPGPQPGHVTLNMTNCTDVDGSDPEAYTKAQLLCRSQVRPLLRFLREHIPGYENAYRV
ncbi:MAG TPA: FAD-dependent oxidoreductase, partial [Clostridia bacterium]|nr:FAD-dependent oxidoreductase [Clostridia bacterium]